MDRELSFAPRIHFGPECWEWMGPTRGKGYGAFGDKYAHRYAYEMAYGPIPTGLCVLHKCDNPRCVRRDHLFLGTISDNNADMCAKGRHHNQVRTHCRLGHEYTEENTRIYTWPSGKSGRFCRKCDCLRPRRKGW